MGITIHTGVFPHDDPDASLAFYRDTLGCEVRGDVGNGGMRWITVGPADQPGTSILLAPLAADPGITDDERRTFARLEANDAEVVQEPNRLDDTLRLGAISRQGLARGSPAPRF